MTGLPQRLKELAVRRLPPGIAERIAEEWQAHLDALPDRLSKLSAVAGFWFSTFWGFRRYREDETPIEIEERIAFEVALALNQQREQIRSILEGLKTETDLAIKEAEKVGAEEAKRLLRADENRTVLVKRRTNGRFSPFALSYGYKTTRHRGRPSRYKTRPR